MKGLLYGHNELPEVGTRVELLSMPHDPDPVPQGMTGTVTGSHAGYLAQVYVAWDNGRTLSLVPGVDRWRVLPPDNHPMSCGCNGTGWRDDMGVRCNVEHPR